MKQRGFSLIELLVVIAIIAVLIALLSPAFNRISDKAKLLKCRRNLVSQGQGMMLYASEHKVLPGAHERSQSGRIVGAWATRIRHYLGGERNAFVDPATHVGIDWPRDVQGTGGGDRATPQDVGNLGYELGERLLDVFRVPFAYGYNDWGSIRRQPSNPQRGLGGDLWALPQMTLSLIVKPSRMFAISCTSEPDGTWDFNIDPYNPREYPGKVHDNGCNMLFVDGHVKWFLRKDIVQPGNSPEGIRIRRMWNSHHRETQE